jgi:hypothetical protein
VPEEVNVVDVRVLRARGARKRGLKPIGSQLFRTPDAGAYELKLTSRKLRRLAPGRYEVHVRTGASRKELGGVTRRVIKVVEAPRRRAGS